MVLPEKPVVRLCNQEIPRVLWNPKVHYRVQKQPSPAPVQPHEYSSTVRNNIRIQGFRQLRLKIILPSSLWNYTFQNHILPA
jgi:hypothetical protein